MGQTVGTASGLSIALGAQIGGRVGTALIGGGAVGLATVPLFYLGAIEPLPFPDRSQPPVWVPWGGGVPPVLIDPDDFDFRRDMPLGFPAIGL